MEFLSPSGTCFLKHSTAFWLMLRGLSYKLHGQGNSFQAVESESTCSCCLDSHPKTARHCSPSPKQSRYPTQSYRTRWQDTHPLLKDRTNFPESSKYQMSATAGLERELLSHTKLVCQPCPAASATVQEADLFLKRISAKQHPLFQNV